MARPKLSSLLMETPAQDAAVQPESTATPKATDVKATEPARPTTPPKAAEPAPAPAPAQPARSQSKTKPQRPADAGPRYLEFQRKEARFTDQQYQDLTVLSRRLNKARQGSGERITENTLIRVAVDLLLQGQDRLKGATEGELRKSVGL